LAPEHWQEVMPSTAAADLYAFGILLSKLLTGRHALLDLEQPQSEAAWRPASRISTRRSVPSIRSSGPPRGRRCPPCRRPQANWDGTLRGVRGLSAHARAPNDALECLGNVLSLAPL